MLSQAYYQFIGHLKTCMKLKYCHDAIAIMKCKDDKHRKSVCESATKLIIIVAHNFANKEG
jgi:hypothetical protein